MNDYGILANPRFFTIALTAKMKKIHLYGPLIVLGRIVRSFPVWLTLFFFFDKLAIRINGKNINLLTNYIRFIEHGISY